MQPRRHRPALQQIRKRIMRNFLMVTLPRVALGLLFLVSAVDGFWWLATGSHLIHPPTSERGLIFEAALQNSGFFWPFLKAVNLAGGLSLLFNIVPAFGLALIAPVMAVIVLFHFAINPAGIPVAIILIVTGGLLIYAYRERYAALLR
jgi:hypothetical protein